ncbi:MAG: nitrous oxide reductase accessory protein NosL [Pseudomonadota bacterium]
MRYWQNMIGGAAAALFFTLAAVPVAPANAAETYPPQTVSKQQRCPVCGMYPARYPRWQGQIIFKDNKMSAFESPAELFRFRFDMAKFDKEHSAADIAQIYLSDYNGSGWVKAEQAVLVVGSDTNGPMGADMPAFKSSQDAERFAKEHGGQAVPFGQVSPETLQTLRHPMHH